MQIIKEFCFIVFILLGQTAFGYEKLPDFNQYKDLKQKKNHFFEYLRPLADKANQEVMHDRLKLIALKKQSNLSQSDINWLKKTALAYKVKKTSQAAEINALLNRVDIIPSSMLLAQAAHESAWGSSRFAREGNNLFGQWCYKKNCGLVPKKRSKGKHHEVKVFSSAYDSIKAYLHNLNTNFSYKTLRHLREQLRTNNKKITGTALSAGLVHYSERRLAYVKDIQKMIKANHLE